MREAARKIAGLGMAATQTWEELAVAGQLIISQVLEAIDDADVFAGEVTSLNPNVMFELGYAIGTGKRIWPMYDEADATAEQQWRRLRILTTIGYAPYINSDDVRSRFLADSPHLQATSLLDIAIRPGLQPSAQADIFYLHSAFATDASRHLTRRLDLEERRGRRTIHYDPSEGSVYPFTWYAQQIYNATVVIAHLSPRRHHDASIHNARAALMAGVARGFGKKVLMVVEEEDDLTPLDYRDLSYTYRTSTDLSAHVDVWLGTALEAVRPSNPAASLALETELRSLTFGEPVAENEASDLPSYFVETAAYRHVLERNTTVFVGRKGCGKTANFLQATHTLRRDPQNVVCVIQPSSYELEAVVRLLGQFEQEDQRTYAVEALWQFLLVSEVARVLAEQFQQRILQPSPESPEGRLIDYVNNPDNGIDEEFSVRLENVVAAASAVEATGGVADFREAITQTIHGTHLVELRTLLDGALSQRDRVCVLIDNLDKAWDRSADLDKLSHLLLGLLTAIRRISTFLRRSDSRRRSIDVSLAVFLRSDIFERITRIAREPDKIPLTRLTWDDPELLLRVLEERYIATHDGSAPEDLWTRFFVADVDGVSVREFILANVLPRPRDVVQFCAAALDSAVNRRHDRIDEEDLRSALALYSQFAFEALLVENGLTIAELESVLFEFAGAPTVLDSEWLEDAVMRAGLTEDRIEQVVARLRHLSFLGIETADGRFSYEEDARDERRLAALARNLSEQRGSAARFEVHPAYRAYLDMSPVDQEV
ncbi:MAG: hypothetical protein AB7H43_04710 [Acidimicrobiia bacterium]